MPFPVSIRGSVPIPDHATEVPDAGIIIACVDQIEHEGAHATDRNERSIAFTSPLFRTWGSSWRFTVPVSAGTFEIVRDSSGRRRITYELSTRRTALVGTILVAGMFGFMALTTRMPFPRWVPLVFWGWIVGVNYVSSFVRAPFWVRRRIADAAKIAAYRRPTVRQPDEL